MTKLRLIIGQQIAMLRKKHGLTIRELSELSGINSSNISKIDSILNVIKNKHLIKDEENFVISHANP
jgi:transcriptional regulator with XRE-family HTH domain